MIEYHSVYTKKQTICPLQSKIENSLKNIN